jgi:hypothetical protein
MNNGTFVLLAFTSASTLVHCNPCAAPTVPTSVVTVSDEQGGAVIDAQVTAQNAAGTVTFRCDNQSGDAGVTSDASGAAPPADAASLAPRSGTSCSSAGGLSNGPYTVRVSAPGFVSAERVVSMSELTMPTGCGFALNVSFVLRRQ